jgi:Ca-activated chloride channel homolog
LILAQKKIDGKLTSADSVQYTIISAQPDSFPAISIVFRAYKINGDPIWKLSKENFSVSEDNNKCKVLSINQISNDKSINIGIVIDHSGSMLEDDSQLLDKWGDPLSTYDFKTSQWKLPEGFVSPIDNAKVTTKEFAQSFNFKKDFISIIGFSSIVDKVLPLTNNKTKIDSIINKMEATDRTALYDAMIAGLNEIKNKNSVNVLVTLTDGNDNESKFNSDDVIREANENNIPIFIIGLGNVNKNALQSIADRTKGKFVYTETSKSFKEIYSTISKDIQSFYDLKYESPNLSSTKIKRDIQINFISNSGKIDSLNYYWSLPQEVIAYLQATEKKRDYLIKGIMISAIVVSSTSILIFRKRKKKIKSKVNP